MNNNKMTDTNQAKLRAIRTAAYELDVLNLESGIGFTARKALTQTMSTSPRTPYFDSQSFEVNGISFEVTGHAYDLAFSRMGLKGPTGELLIDLEDIASAIVWGRANIAQGEFVRLWDKFNNTYAVINPFEFHGKVNVLTVVRNMKNESPEDIVKIENLNSSNQGDNHLLYTNEL